MQADCDIDVLIFGGGIAGLWTLRRLLIAGFEALLLEQDALGAGQTIASQGIIHGGLKYTLGGGGGSRATAAAGAIADMPARWRASLEGSNAAEPDLREARILSPRQHLFTAPGFAARIAGAAASKVIRTDVARLKPQERFPALAGAPASCHVYSVAEPVLEPRSILAALAAGVSKRLARLPENAATAFERADSAVTIRLNTSDGERQTIRAGLVVLAAGAGNETLLAQLGALADGAAHPPQMQRRPLHMVMARSPALPPLYAHCVGASSRPLLTITSQPDAAGRTVWYIGGELAERGVERDEPAQIAAAREELARLMPWIDTRDAEFATLRIDRAEALSDTGARPDLPTIAPATDDGRIVAAWPTKLAFAPLIADMIEARVREAGIAARAQPGNVHEQEQDREHKTAPPISLGLPAPAIATLPWNREDLRWS